MSHVDPDIVSSILYDIDAKCGNISKMTIAWGKIHKYFGMTIDYSSPVKLVFYMVDYIENMLYDTTEYIKE